MRHRTSQRLGFTLVELLVFILVLTVLVSLVLGAVIKARDHSRQALCAANLAAIGTAMHAYASDSSGEIPPVYGMDGGRERATAFFGAGPWSSTINGGLLLLLGSHGSSNHKLYLDSAQVFRCPGDSYLYRLSDTDYSEGFIDGSERDSYMYTYVPRDGTCDQWWNYHPLDKYHPGALHWVPGAMKGFERHNLNQKDCISLAIMIEGVALYRPNLPRVNQDFHGKGGNILFLDGHVVFGRVVVQAITSPDQRYSEWREILQIADAGGN
jgi:prepilin-type processing-associated H-X9-DG protein